MKKNNLFILLVIFASLVIRNGVCDELTLRMVDVGMAECLIVTINNEVMLVDTAYAQNTSQVQNALHDMDVQEIKYLVLTHPHADHISGAREIINSFSIGATILPPIESSTEIYNKTMGVLKEKDVELIYPQVGDIFKLGGAEVTIYAPHPVAYDSLNNWSLVLMIEYSGRKILLTGDIEIEAEYDLLLHADCLPLKADILKVAHHGSNTSSMYSFIEAVSPEYAIISCGEDGNKEYPDVETAMNLFDCGVLDIWTTQMYGDIIIRIDEEGEIYASPLNDA